MTEEYIAEASAFYDPEYGPDGYLSSLDPDRFTPKGSLSNRNRTWTSTRTVLQPPEPEPTDEYLRRMAHVVSGLAGEKQAIIWLWRNGYEVFENVAHFGESDLIAKKDGVLEEVDVTISKDIALRKLKIKRPHVRVLLITGPDTCEWIR